MDAEQSLAARDDLCASSGQNHYDFSYKVILLGGTGVGKSSFLLRLSRNEFNPNINLSVSIEFSSIYTQLAGKTVKTTVYDTAGQERFRAIARAYYRKVDGVLLMYSVQDRSSFDQISAYWMEELKKEAPDAVINLVACKSDLGGRCVSTQEGMEYARSHPLHFEETSSKDDINIQKVFQNLVTEIYIKKGEGRLRCADRDIIQIGAGDRNPPRNSCCAVRLWDRIAH